MKTSASPRDPCELLSTRAESLTLSPVEKNEHIYMILTDRKYFKKKVSTGHRTHHLIESKTPPPPPLLPRDERDFNTKQFKMERARKETKQNTRKKHW
jgi:hypothetical protein